MLTPNDILKARQNFEPIKNKLEKENPECIYHIDFADNPIRNIVWCHPKNCDIRTYDFYRSAAMKALESEK